MLVHVLQTPAAPGPCVHQTVECLTALVPHVVDCDDLKHAALACSDVQRRRWRDAPGASWVALDLVIATQAVSSGTGREVERCQRFGGHSGSPVIPLPCGHTAAVVG